MPMFVFIWPWVLGTIVVTTAAKKIYDVVTEDNNSSSRSYDDGYERAEYERRRQRERDRANACAVLEQEAYEELIQLVQNHSAILSGQPRKLDLSGLKRFVQNPRLPDADLGVRHAPAWEKNGHALEALEAEIAALERFRAENRPSL